MPAEYSLYFLFKLKDGKKQTYSTVCPLAITSSGMILKQVFDPCFSDTYSILLSFSFNMQSQEKTINIGNIYGSINKHTMDFVYLSFILRLAFPLYMNLGVTFFYSVSEQKI